MSAASLPAPEISDIRRGVLRLVLYFDVFRHPLLLSELVRLVSPGRPELVAVACDLLEAEGLIAAAGRYRFRPGGRAAVRRREERARAAERVWGRARHAGALLAQLPFVRGVMVTGGLSKNSAKAGDDVDFLLLVQPGRVWTLKSALQVARRALPGGVRELFCTNYLLATDALLIDERNAYTAVELATAVPIAGRDACVALLEANRWAERWVPGLEWSVERARLLPAGGPALSQDSPAVPSRVEAAAMQAWNRYWEHKYAWLPEAQRARRFKRRAEIATNHLHDFQEYVLRELGSRCASVGLHEPLSEHP